MPLLLDAHAFLWWLAGDEALTAAAQDAIGYRYGTAFVSAASVWEIATEHRLGRLPGVFTIVANLDEIVLQQGFTPLSITVRHAQVAGGLPGPQRDPFDRTLIEDYAEFTRSFTTIRAADLRRQVEAIYQSRRFRPSPPPALRARRTPARRGSIASPMRYRSVSVMASVRLREG